MNIPIWIINPFVFSDLAAFDKVSTAIRNMAAMLDIQYLTIGSNFFKFLEYPACTDSGFTGYKNVPNIVSISHYLEQFYSSIFNGYIKACLNI